MVFTSAEGVALPAIPTTAAGEIALLNAQLESMREYHGALLSTVYWSLGAIGALALLLVGLSWFTNNRFYEHDKAALKQELIGLIKQQASDLRHEALGVVDEVAEKSARNTMSPLVDELRELRRDVLGLQFKALEAEGEKWEVEGVPTNAVRAYQEILELQLKTNSGMGIMYLEGALGKLSNSLGKCDWIYTGHAVALANVVGNLPSKYSSEGKGILDRLQRIKRAD
jgi:hypothetical protein